MIEVALYAMLDTALDVPVDGRDPYDPTIGVEARITGDGVELTWPAFFDGTGWRLRYQPQARGTQRVEVRLDGGVVDAFAVRVGPADGPGPIHVDGFGFRHPDGAPFVPIGLNLGWGTGDDYARWLPALGDAGGTFARVWVTHFTGQNPWWDDPEALDPEAAGRIDDVLDGAAAAGVSIQLVLWQHSQLEAMTWSSWADNPYNADNGGPCADSACFFADPTALAWQARMVRYAVARWGAHPALGVWEIVNEAGSVTGVSGDVVAAWAAAQADAVRALDGGLHPVTWSYALPPHVETGQVFAGADATQVHSYLFADVGPVRDGVAAALEADAAPVLVGEWGLDWFGNNDRADTAGVAWHNASWAALASGSAGNALTWWWDDHVEPHDLWHVVTGPAAVAAVVDLPALGPATATADGYDVIARQSDVEALVWVHDPDATWDAPAPALRRGVALDLGELPDGCATFYDTVGGGAVGTAVPEDGAVALPDFAGDVAVVLTAAPCATERACGCASSTGAVGWWLLAPLVLVRRQRTASQSRPSRH